MSNLKTNIFISYSWKNSIEIDILEADFRNLNVTIIRDQNDLNYKDNLVEYMNKIRSTDFAIVFLTDDYLRSLNCMYELKELYKEVGFSKKVLPILHGSVDIFTTKGRLKYLNHWKKQLNSSQKKVKDIEAHVCIDIHKTIKQINEVYSGIDEILATLSGLKLMTFSALKNEGYKSIISELGFPDVSYLVDLLIINQVKDVEKRDILLEKHLQVFGASTYYYSMRGSFSASIKQYQKAKFLYEKAIELDSNNTTPLNNLGLLLQHQFGEYDLAKEYFTKVINIDSKHSIAKLNLGILYSKHFSDHKSALQQYEEILKYESNAAAHNNIANCYRGTRDIAVNIDKVHYHFKMAIQIKPTYTEAYLNYGNFLKTQLGDVAEGNKYYKMGRKSTSDKHVKNIFTILIKKMA